MKGRSCACTSARRRRSSFPSPDSPFDVLITLSPMNIVQCAADLLFSPVLRKYPDLRLALSEGGIGWIPYFLERVDYVYSHHKAWTGQDFGDMLPSQVFSERIVTCFIDDAFGVESRAKMNVDNICWECDYPHSDSTWPQAPEMAMKYLDGVSDAEVKQDHPRERHPALPLRPLQRPAPGEVHGRRAAGRGHRRGHVDDGPQPQA